MTRTILAAAGVATAGLLFFATPASADEPPPPPQLPSLGELGFDPSLTVCANMSTPIPFIGLGGCSPDITPYFGIG